VVKSGERGGRGRGGEERGQCYSRSQRDLGQAPRPSAWRIEIDTYSPVLGEARQRLHRYDLAQPHSRRATGPDPQLFADSY